MKWAFNKKICPRTGFNIMIKSVPGSSQCVQNITILYPFKGINLDKPSVSLPAHVWSPCQHRVMTGQASPGQIAAVKCEPGMGIILNHFQTMPTPAILAKIPS